METMSEHIKELHDLISKLNGKDRKRALKLLNEVLEDLENAYEGGRAEGIQEASRIAYLWGGGNCESRVLELHDRTLEEIEGTK